MSADWCAARVAEASALREDVRRKLTVSRSYGARGRHAHLASYFRLDALLADGDAQAAALAATEAEAARSEANMLHYLEKMNDALERESVTAQRLAILRDAFAAETGKPAPFAPENAVLHPTGPWTEGLERNRQQLQADYFVMKQRALAAEVEVAGLRERDRLVAEAEQARQAAADAEDAQRLAEARKQPFTGCWWNSACPCNPTDPNDCPCYLGPEEDASAPAAGGTAAAGMRFPNAAFATEAEYDASVASAVARIKSGEVSLRMCCADRDGDCSAVGCPQLRDNEPHATGRSCPLPGWGQDDDED